MDVDEIRRLQEESDQDTLAFLIRLQARWAGLRREWEAAGVTMEYVHESDHLYITFGPVRESVAIFIGPLVFCVNPDDEDDIVGIDIPMCSTAMRTKELARLRWVLPVLRLFPKLVLPPRSHDRSWAWIRDIPSIVRRVRAQLVIGGVQRFMLRPSPQVA